MRFICVALLLGCCAESLPRATQEELPHRFTLNAFDPWKTRVPGIGHGHLIVTGNSYNDVFLHNPQENLAVGIRLSWGGAIVYFGPLDETGLLNAVDENDPGRLIQPAIYDSSRFWQACAEGASCTYNSPGCAAFGWDPVQAGDVCGHSSPANSYRLIGDTLHIVSTPVQWNPYWNQADATCMAGGMISGDDCPSAATPATHTFTTDIRFVSERVFELSMESQVRDELVHTNTPIDVSQGYNLSQEFPAVYANTILTQAVTSSGRVISWPADQFSWFGSPKPWMAFKKPDSTVALGVYNDEGATQFLLVGAADSFHYMRFANRFAIASTKQRFISYFAYGSFAQVGSDLVAVTSKRPPFGLVETSLAPSGGHIRVNGWVLDTAHIQTVDVKINTNPVLSVPVNQTRTDICTTYPGYNGCPKVGFDTTLTAPSGVYSVQVSARDTDGNVTVLGKYFSP